MSQLPMELCSSVESPAPTFALVSECVCIQLVRPGVEYPKLTYFLANSDKQAGLLMPFVDLKLQVSESISSCSKQIC